MVCLFLLVPVFLALRSSDVPELAETLPISPHTKLIISAAQADAAAYQGFVPCGGRVKVELAPGLGGGVAAWSSWDDYTGFLGVNIGDEEGPSVKAHDFTNCTIAVNMGYFEQLGGLLQSWAEFCEAMAHEYEHLSNRWQVETRVDHGVAPLPSVASVAYPSFTGKNEPAQCEHAPRGAGDEFTQLGLNAHFGTESLG